MDLHQVSDKKLSPWPSFGRLINKVFRYRTCAIKGRSFYSKFFLSTCTVVRFTAFLSFLQHMSTRNFQKRTKIN